MNVVVHSAGDSFRDICYKCDAPEAAARARVSDQSISIRNPRVTKFGHPVRFVGGQEVNPVGLTREQVLDQIGTAIERTESRLKKYPEGSNRFGRLNARREQLNVLQRELSNSDAWRKFGGFTGWASVINKAYRVPARCHYGQFHGWLERDDATGRYLEVSLNAEVGLINDPIIRGSEPEPQNWFKRASDYLKGTDGWDELGSAFGQTLPGVGQHIATISMLSFLSYFVWLGVKGMASELDEAKAKLKSILHSDQASQDKLIKLFDLMPSEKDFYRDGLEKLKKLNQKGNTQSFEQKAFELAKYQRIQFEKKSIQLAHEATPFGLGAMTGMCLGMPAAITASSLELAVMESLAGVFEVLTGSIFIGSQLAMIVYGRKKYKEGKAIETYVQKKQADLDQLAEKNNLLKAANDNLGRIKTYNQRSKINYGKGIAAAETGMIVGGIFGLASVIPASLLFLIPSAVSTLLIAAYRIRYEILHGRYVGRFGGHIHNGNVNHAWKDVGRRVVKSATQDTQLPGVGVRSKTNPTAPLKEGLLNSRKPEWALGCVDGCMDHREYDGKLDLNIPDLKDLYESHQKVTARLAETKLQSLLLTQIRNHDARSEVLAEQLESLPSKVNRGTTLQMDVIDEIKTTFASEYEKTIAQVESEHTKFSKLLVLAKKVVSEDSTTGEFYVRQKIIRKLLSKDLFFKVNNILGRAQRPGLVYRLLGGVQSLNNIVSVNDLYRHENVDADALQSFYKIALRQIITSEKAQAKVERQENFESLYLYAGAVSNGMSE